MEIIINTDSRVQNTPGLREHVTSVVQQELKHVSENVTRIEVHLRDVNSDKKGGEDDKKCLIEARVAGSQPVVAEHYASEINLALSGATKQLARALHDASAKARDLEKRAAAQKRIEPNI